jgi:hypothetical protein
MFFNSEATLDLIDRLVLLDHVVESIGATLQYFHAVSESQVLSRRMLRLKRSGVFPQAPEFPTPDEVLLPESVLQKLVDDGHPGAQVFDRSYNR